jgi:hypothetical protein
MTDIMIVLIVAALVGAAARYVYKAKKNGAKCIGCAVGNGGCHCQGGCGGCIGCAGEE